MNDILTFIIILQGIALVWMYTKLATMARAQQAFADANLKTAQALVGLQNVQELIVAAVKGIEGRSRS